MFIYGLYMSILQMSKFQGFINNFLFCDDLQGLEWHAMMALNMPTNYIGQLTGQLETTFDLSTGQAHFTNLSIDAIGLSYILEVTVVTMPSSTYELTLLVDPFDVVSSQQMNYTGPIRRLKLQFLVDYDVVAAGKEAQLEIYVLNYFSARYTGVQICNVSLERGIIATFCMRHCQP